MRSETPSPKSLPLWGRWLAEGQTDEVIPQIIYRGDVSSPLWLYACSLLPEIPLQQALEALAVAGFVAAGL